MPKKPTNNVSSKELSLSQKNSFISKLDRLIQQLEQIDVSSIMVRGDPRITSADAEIEGMLVDMFGSESVRYQNYSTITPLDGAGYYTDGRDSTAEAKVSIGQRLPAAISVLKSIRNGFQSDKAPEVDKAQSIQETYNGLELHPRIAAAASLLYRDGHYSNAVQEAVKALTLYVKEKSGVISLDGTGLMQQVFSVNNPILKLNLLVTQSDKDEQQGFMHLFCGAILAIRNPRAHEQIVDEPERALEFIGFISLLAKNVDIAKK